VIDLPDIPWVVCDTETSGLFADDGARVACAALAYYDVDKDDMWSIGLPYDQGVRDKIPSEQLDLFASAEDPNLPKGAWDFLLKWLRRRRVGYHNAKFDLCMMRVGTRHWSGLELLPSFHWDTMLAQRVLDPREKAGLDATARRLGFGEKQGLDAVKAWLAAHKYPKSRYDLVPWHVIAEYVVTDAEMTAYLYAHQQRRLETEPWITRWNIDNEFGKMATLYSMEKRGLGYDYIRSEEAAQELERRADEIEARMPFTAKDAKRYFFGELNLVPDRLTDAGQPSLDEQQVRKWQVEGVPFAREYAEVSKVRRAVSMWYRGYAEKVGTDGRLRTSFRQTTVRSGRMSVERVQLQAMPKADKYNDMATGKRLPIYEGIPDVRDLIVAKEGYGIWNLDLSQAELRVASQYAQCRTMLDELLSPEPDIHGKTTERVLGTKRDAPDWKLKRDIGKRLTFSAIFQVGGKTFAETLAKMADIYLDEVEADSYVREWRRMYPEFGYAYRKAEKRVYREGNVRLLPGTKYETLSWFGERDWPNTAWNRMVQGSLAFFFGMWLAELERRWPGYGILTIHDSIMLECPLDEGDQVSAEVAKWGAETATELFGIQMMVDTDRYR
jgi:DNA polymerase I-like protein with 3'-5' exonuclease and polymerase domains